MLRHWQGVEKAGKPPNTNDIARKRWKEEQAEIDNEQEEEEQHSVRKQEIQEGRIPETSPGSGTLKFETKNTVRKQEERQEIEKEVCKEVTSREEKESKQGREAPQPAQMRKRRLATSGSEEPRL